MLTHGLCGGTAGGGPEDRSLGSTIVAVLARIHTTHTHITHRSVSADLEHEAARCSPASQGPQSHNLRTKANTKTSSHIEVGGGGALVKVY